MPSKKQNIIEFEMTAVIPVAQYANVQPVVKGYGSNWEEARDDALTKTKEIWSMVGEGGKSIDVRDLKQSSVPMATDTLKCFITGTEVGYEPLSHSYDKGWMSGSAFAAQFEHEFDAKAVAPRSENKLGISSEEIIEYWQSKADISTTFGTALHKALEHYGKYQNIIELDIDPQTGESKGTGIHPTLEPIVLSYFEGREKEVAAYEPFIADAANKRCGQVDRLVILDEKAKVCEIHDYKTNGDLEKLGKPKALKAPYDFLPNNGIGRYTLQQSFYAAILEAAGWTVKRIILDHWNGEVWNEIELDRVSLDIPKTPINLGDMI